MRRISSTVRRLASRRSLQLEGLGLRTSTFVRKSVLSGDAVSKIEKLAHSIELMRLETCQLNARLETDMRDLRSSVSLLSSKLENVQTDQFKSKAATIELKHAVEQHMHNTDRCSSAGGTSSSEVGSGLGLGADEGHLHEDISDDVGQAHARSIRMGQGGEVGRGSGAEAMMKACSVRLEVLCGRTAWLAGRLGQFTARC